MSSIDMSQFSKMPRWAIVAFIARCARRMLPSYEFDKFEPADRRCAVAQAVRLAEVRATLGGKWEYYEEAIIIEDQFYDHYDIDALTNALSGYATSAYWTHVEVGDEAWPCLAIVQLANIALEAATLSPDTGTGVGDLPELADRALSWTRRNGEPIGSEVLDDFRTIQQLVDAEAWNDLTAVPPSVFVRP